MMKSKTEGESIAIFGANGHTGRFVIDELERRGYRVLRVGRDPARLRSTDADHREPARIASIDDRSSLDDALAGAAAAINCAGPFMDTALPIVDAALRAGIPYLDVCAEQATVQSLFEARHEAAIQAAVPVIPAAAFFGGLADLLATAAADGAENIDRISVAVGLDSWHPTAGTRVTGQRNTAPRLVQRRGRLQPLPAPPPAGHWQFPEPLGPRQVIMIPFSETITLASHLPAETIESWINVEAIRDVRDPATPGPMPTDEIGRSPQTFVMDVAVTARGRHRCATAAGRDIYQISAPIVVEAVQRLLSAGGIAGVRSLGDAFDARDFLSALEPHGIQTIYSELGEEPCS